MAEPYRPDLRWFVDWDDDQSFFAGYAYNSGAPASGINANADITDDIYGYDVKFGLEAAVAESQINFISARGEIELYNRDGRYSSEGPNAFDAAALRKRHPVQLRFVDPNPNARRNYSTRAWAGLAEPPQPVNIPGEHPRALMRLRGRFYDQLIEQKQYAQQGGLAADRLFRDAVEVYWGATMSRDPGDRLPWPNYYSGSVDFEGSLRQWLSAYGRWAGGYPYEKKNGEIGFRTFMHATRDTSNAELGGPGSFLDETIYPALANYPRVAGVRNRLGAESYVVALGQSETFFVFTVSLAAGQFTNRLLTVEDSDVLSVSNWGSSWQQTPDPNQPNPAVLAPAVAAARYTTLGNQNQVNVTIRNNSAVTVTVTVTVTGRAYRLTQGATQLVENAASQASYGLRDASEEFPPWFLAPGLSRSRYLTGEQQAKAIIDRMATPVRFVRIVLPGWLKEERQPTIAARNLYQLGPGDRVHVTLPDEGTGYGSLTREPMIVAAVRYTGRIGRMPRVELDLLAYTWG